MQWTPKLSARCASALASLACFFSAISPAVADWSADDSRNLSELVTLLNGSVFGSYGWPAQDASASMGIATNLQHVLVGPAWQQQNALRVFVTNGYDDTWLRYFLTGREDGENSSPPVFRYAGNSAVSSDDTTQNIQQFLSYTLGQFFWHRRGSSTWDNAFKQSSATPSATSMGGTYNLFTVWLAEALRRSIATNQAAVSQLQQLRYEQRNTDTRLLSVISGLHDVRDAIQNAQPPAQEIPASTSVTNPVELASGSYQPSLPEDELNAREGEITPVPFGPPSTSSLSESFDIGEGDGNPVLTLWDSVELAGVSLPAGRIDFSSESYRYAVPIFGKISTTLWWLLYYLALAKLLRREYVYYTSLGHTEGAS